MCLCVWAGLYVHPCMCLRVLCRYANVSHWWNVYAQKNNFGIIIVVVVIIIIINIIIIDVGVSWEERTPLWLEDR